MNNQLKNNWRTKKNRLLPLPLATLRSSTRLTKQYNSVNCLTINLFGEKIKITINCQTIDWNCQKIIDGLKKTQLLPLPLATLRSSTRLTKQHNSSCLSLFSTSSASIENPHMVSTFNRFSSNWYKVFANISMISWLWACKE